MTSALQRAKDRLSHARIGAIDWYWPPDEKAETKTSTDTVRLLAPFDPVVHDRARFKLFWDWEYRLEAYTPVPKRKLGYYALPLLWRERVIGWGNLAIRDGRLTCDFGYVGSAPREVNFKRELDAEVERIKTFLGCR
jgi:uncharacterized protein YcaQ